MRSRKLWKSLSFWSFDFQQISTNHYIGSIGFGLPFILIKKFGSFWSLVQVLWLFKVDVLENQEVWKTSPFWGVFWLYTPIRFEPMINLPQTFFNMSYLVSFNLKKIWVIMTIGSNFMAIQKLRTGKFRKPSVFGLLT